MRGEVERGCLKRGQLTRVLVQRLLRLFALSNVLNLNQITLRSDLSFDADWGNQHVQVDNSRFGGLIQAELLDFFEIEGSFISHCFASAQLHFCLVGQVGIFEEPKTLYLCEIRYTKHAQASRISINQQAVGVVEFEAERRFVEDGLESLVAFVQRFGKVALGAGLAGSLFSSFPLAS